MNKIITNLSLIADAAEYFDRKCGSAWKIRSALTNFGVWAANALLYAQKADNVERIASASVTLATLRVWLRDANTSSFTLDLTPSAVKRTLGLERQVDAHAEACRVARTKCLQTRSALNFKKFYNSALSALEEQRKQREESVEQIAELLADNQVFFDHALADHFEVHNLGSFEPEHFIDDGDLYDDASVERQADQLAETVGNALESMYDVCEAELAAAITTDKIARLTGYSRAINSMLEICGVDKAKLAKRRAQLEAQIESLEKDAAKDVAKIEADIEAQLAEQPEPTRDAKGRFRRVKQEDLAKELAQ